MNKIVVLDGYPANPGDLSWDELKTLGDVRVYEKTLAADIVAHIGDASCIFTNKVPITRSTVESCPNLRFIGVLATGYNIIDTEAAKEKGIIVSNIPSYSTEAVAQYVFALLLEICHHVGHHGSEMLICFITGNMQTLKY